MREYAGDDLTEIRQSLHEEGFTELALNRGKEGFALWRPFAELPSHDCAWVTVWPRAEGGYWSEQY